MPLEFTQPEKGDPLVKNFSDNALEKFRIGRARSLDFGYYFAVNGVWRWVSIVTSGDRQIMAGHCGTEEEAVGALNAIYTGFLKAAGLAERRRSVARPRASQAQELHA